MKIGIIICNRYNNCAGGKCFKAMRNHEGAFDIYKNDDKLEIVGYIQCGGCPGGNIEYAPEEMIKNGAEVIHFATGFIVGYSDYPQEVIDKSNPRKMLDGARDGAVGNVGGELIDEMELAFQDYPGREIEVEVPGKATIRARLILIDNRLYQVMVISPSVEILEKKGTEFFDSFAVGEQ